MLGIKMNAWSWIIVGGTIMTLGGIMVGYGWHIMPKKGRLPENRKHCQGNRGCIRFSRPTRKIKVSNESELSKE
jgi:hypothetical protein